MHGSASLTMHIRAVIFVSAALSAGCANPPESTASPAPPPPLAKSERKMIAPTTRRARQLKPDTPENVRRFMAEGEPFLYFLREGTVGRIIDATVESIVDDRNMIVQLKLYSKLGDNDGGPTVWLTGVETGAFVDGSHPYVPAIEVIGRRQYGGRTRWLVRRIKITDYLVDR